MHPGRRKDCDPMREKNDCLIIGHTSIESYRDLETVISGHQAPTAALLLAYLLSLLAFWLALLLACLPTCWLGSRLQLAATEVPVTRI